MEWTVDGMMYHVVEVDQVHHGTLHVALVLVVAVKVALEGVGQIAAPVRQIGVEEVEAQLHVGHIKAPVRQ